MNSNIKSNYRYYEWVMAAFVTVLLCSNLIGAAKVCEIGGYRFSAGNIFFPLSYIFGDILTEVYGYARARRVVWAGFGALAFASLMSWLVVHIPSSPDWPNQGAYEVAFGNTWRIACSSLLAFWAGEFSNSFVLAKMKILTKGKHLWARTIGSTMVGEMVDSLIFYPLAFWGLWPAETILHVLVQSYMLKVGWEVVMTPFTYRVVKFLKRAEHEDYYDYKTDFNPFTLEPGTKIAP